MENKEYKELKYPDSLSPDFIQYIKDNNVVLADYYGWLVIENIKYHTKEDPHYTLFYNPKTYREDLGFYEAFYQVLTDLKTQDWHIYKNAKKDCSIQRDHWHVVKNIDNYYKKYFNGKE